MRIKGHKMVRTVFGLDIIVQKISFGHGLSKATGREVLERSGAEP